MYVLKKSTTKGGMPMIVFCSCLTAVLCQLFECFASQCAANVLGHRRELWHSNIPGGTLAILTVCERSTGPSNWKGDEWRGG